MAESSIHLILLCSFLIALIVFVSKPWFLMYFILIFIYLLPRAGFLLFTKWYYYPLPIGYILIIFILIKWLFLRLLFEKKNPRKHSPIDKIFPFYIIIILIGILIGIVNKGKPSTLILEVIVYFVAFFIFFMILDIFGNMNCINIFIGGILTVGFVVSLYGIFLLIYGKDLLINYVTYNSTNYAALLGQFIIAKRTISSYGDPNALSSQLMVFCGIFGSLLFLGKNHPVKKIFLSLSLTLTIICIYFASSRASLAGLFILALIFAVTKVKKLLLYIPALVTSYIIFIEPIRRYYVHRVYIAGISDDLRITYIKVFFDFLIRFPFGIGFGNYIDESYNIISADNIWFGFNSFYLHIFSRIGMQGLVVFSLILFIIIRFLLRESIHIKDANLKAFVFGAVCGLIVQQLNFLTNNVYHVPGGMLNFWVICGMLVAIINLYKTKECTG